MTTRNAALEEIFHGEFEVAFDPTKATEVEWAEFSDQAEWAAAYLYTNTLPTVAHFPDRLRDDGAAPQPPRAPDAGDPFGFITSAARWVGNAVGSATNTLVNVAATAGSAVVTAGKATGGALVTAGKATGNAVVTAGKATGNALATAGKAIGGTVVSAANTTTSTVCVGQTKWFGLPCLGLRGWFGAS